MTFCECGLDHDLVDEMAKDGWAMAAKWRVEREFGESRNFSDAHEARMYFLASNPTEGEVHLFSVE